MSQISAGLKKEWLFFRRGFRLGGVVIIFIGCVLFIPLMFGMMNAMGDMMNSAEGAAISESLGDIDTTALFSLYEGEGGLSMAYTGTLQMISSSMLGSIPIAALAAMVFMSGSAGAEQKKRSIIIPQTAGLSVPGYVLPKFILYPPLISLMSFISVYLLNSVCHATFDLSYPSEVVFVTALMTAVSMMFTVCMYLFLGISLAQPRLAIIYVLAGNGVFTTMLALAFEINKFTPWSLYDMCVTVVGNSKAGIDIYSGIGAGNVAVTIAITLILCVAFMLLTLFAMTARKMDNTADEVY